jgi:hypothetical protein
MSEEINDHRRALLGTAAAAIAATQLGMTGLANAQRGKTKPTQLPAIKRGASTSFPALKQIGAGVLNVGYVEAGPADGPAVILFRNPDGPLWANRSTHPYSVPSDCRRRPIPTTLSSSAGR